MYCYDKGNITPLEITKDVKDKHIDLLYLTEKDKNNYCWIQNLEKLVRSQITKHKEKIFLCKMCSTSFLSEEKLKDHRTCRGAHKSVRIKMPKPSTRSPLLPCLARHTQSGR